MPTTTRTRVDGLRELGAAMRALGVDIVKASRGATNAAGQVVKKSARAKIRSNPSIDEGDLERSVIVKRVKSELTSEHIVTVRGRGKPFNKKGQKIDRAPHGGFVEFGTVNMPAEPYLRPAIEQNQQTGTEAMVTVLKKRIDKANRTRP